MATKYLPVLILSVFATFLGACAFGQTEFKHSKKAGLLLAQFDAAVARDYAKIAKEVTEIQVKYGKASRERRETLLAELEKIQDMETKAGNLDAAVEVREAIATLNAPPTEPLTPDDIRARLVGTSWLHDAEHNDGTSWFRFNADGTITASWHKLPSMWSVLPDGTVQLMFSKIRIVRQMRIDPTFRVGTGTGKNAWLYQRIR